MAAHALIPAMQQTAPFQEAERHNAAVLMMAPWGGRLLEASNGLFRESFRGVREVRSFIPRFMLDVIGVFDWLDSLIFHASDRAHITCAFTDCLFHFQPRSTRI